MSGWERNAKRFVKAVIWAVVFVIVAATLDLDPNWRLGALAVTCGLVGDILDIFIPTIRETRGK